MALVTPAVLPLTDRIGRREFQVQGGNLVLPTLALSVRKRGFRFGSMPLLMEAHHGLGLSVTMISEGKLAERPAFDVKDAASNLPVDRNVRHQCPV